MLRKSLVSGLIFSIALIASSVMFTGCPSKVTEEQLAKLKQLRQQEVDFKSQIKDKKNEISTLEKELQARKAELDDCNKETEFVKSKLANWPDVWPDWKPEQK